MRLFSTDIDGTVYRDRDSARQFADFWEDLAGEAESTLLVYNTGRSLEDTRNLVSTTALPTADFFICGVGTQIFEESRRRLLEDWHAELEDGWDFSVVSGMVASRSSARFQPEECQNEFKCSWYWENADSAEIRALVEALAGIGIRSQAVYSSNRDLDFLPEKANKGNALAWLAGWLGVSAQNIVVAGDSGNDASMFHIRGARGILVANAEDALVQAVAGSRPFLASKPCAAGVIEGLNRLWKRSSPETETSPVPL